MLPRIDYLQVYEIIHMQKDAVQQKIQSVMYNKRTAFPGLTAFKEGQKSIDPYQIPGVAESGWFPDLGKSPQQTNPIYPLLRQLLSDIQVQLYLLYTNF